MGYSRVGRGVAAILALIGWVGLGRYIMAEQAEQGGDTLRAFWVNAGYLTDLSNLLLAITLTGVALGRRPLSRPAFVGWAISAILLVGIGFWVIGGRLVWGKSALEDILLHGVTPWAALLFWLPFARKGQLRWQVLPVWFAWPLLYFGYALLRGWLAGDYAYPFLDLGRRGIFPVLHSIAELVAIFGLCALMVFTLDALLGRKSRRARQ